MAKVTPLAAEAYRKNLKAPTPHFHSSLVRPPARQVANRAVERSRRQYWGRLLLRLLLPLQGAAGWRRISAFHLIRLKSSTRTVQTLHSRPVCLGRPANIGRGKIPPTETAETRLHQNLPL